MCLSAETGSFEESPEAEDCKINPGGSGDLNCATPADEKVERHDYP
jgi:hypothetical protein